MFKVVTGISKLNENDLSLMRPLLSKDRQKKVDAFRFTADKISSACAFLTLRLCMAEMGKDEPFKIIADTFGKPRFADDNGLYFSLSHDREGVCAALSNTEIGADIQSVSSFSDDIVEHVLTKKEKQIYSAGNDPAEYFTSLWVMKECFGKKKGFGVFEAIKQCDFSTFKGNEKIYELNGDVFSLGKADDLIFGVCCKTKETPEVIDAEEFLDRIQQLKKYDF